MKKVELKVVSDDATDASPVAVIVEEKLPSGGWKRLDGRDLTTNDAKVPAPFVLRPGQRLVVDPFVVPAMVYDRGQNAAVPADEPKSPPPPPPPPIKPTTPPATSGPSTSVVTDKK